MEKQKFGISALGFNKSDVCKYILELDENIKAKLNAKDEEIARLKQCIEELTIQNLEIQKKKTTIIDTLIKAEENAKKIVDSAKLEADRLLKDAEIKIAEKTSLIDAEAKERLESILKETNSEKESINHEIEIKREEVLGSYKTEVNKINAIKREISNLKNTAIIAVSHLEKELSNVENSTVKEYQRVSESKGDMLKSFPKTYEIQSKMPEITKLEIAPAPKDNPAKIS